MAELEEVYKRKHYKLPIDWRCSKCEQHCRMIGKLLGEDPNPEGGLTWEDILQKHCEKCQWTQRPTRKCSYCDAVYDFDSYGCKNCDLLISTMIDLEEEYNELHEDLRIAKRKKTPTESIETTISNIFSDLINMPAKCCDVCKRYWLITVENFTCNKCLDKV